MEKITQRLDLPERVRWYVNMRWFFVLALAAPGTLPQLLSNGFDNQVRVNLLLTGIGLMINVAFAFLASFRRRSPLFYRTLAGGQIALDIMMVNGLILLNGGIESRTIMAYTIPILMSCAVLEQTAVYLTGVASAFSYITIVLLDYLGIIQPLNILNPAVHSSKTYALRSLFFYVALLLTITVITDYVARLIRQREQLEEEIRGISAEKAQTEAIIKTMGSALVATDPEGRITMVNDSFERLTGWRRLQVLGKPVDEILVMLDEWGHIVPHLQRPLLNILKQDGNATPLPRLVADYYYRRKDGSTFPFISHISPIVLNHTVLGATSVFDDASTTKEMERLKNNFIALVSHQLKTPIGEIKGYVENMLFGLGGKLTKKQSIYLKHMYEVANRSNQLISNLLDISILQRDNLRVTLKPVKVTEVLAQVASIYEERVKQKGLKLEIVESSKELLIVADHNELVEVIGNLLSNSITYSERGTIRITTKEDDRYGIIEVADEGRGMDAQALQTIFHKERVLAEAPAAQSGTGLGLYLARQLVLLQQGDIQVQSTLGKGTTFTIKLPKKGVKLPDMSDNTALVNKDAKTILIVEDELPFRQIYRDILRLDGYNVIEAEDGEEALKLIKQTPPDMVLLDIILPKLTGFDVLSALKKDPKLKQIPVIVYSILNNKAEVDRALKLGANDFTVKGQTPAFEVLNKVRKLLGE